MLGNLISGFVVILVGITLAPTIATSVTATMYTNGTLGTTANPNLTNGSFTIINLVTLFYCISVVTIGIGIAYTGLKQSGMM